jgi:ribosomal protein S18 acetylase RimI-like enzyme
MRVRKAQVCDVSGIARVHVESWRTTYKGIVSADYLSGLTVEQRERNWVWAFRNPNPDEAVFVAETDEGTIVGFCSGGRSRFPAYPYDAELYAIYTLQECQSQGVGRKLAGALVSYLKAKDYKSMMVWVLEKNPAAGFYERLGGCSFSRQEIQIGEETHFEVAYGWESLEDVKV